MANTFFIYSYNNSSKGMLELAKALRNQNKLNFKGVIRHQDSKFRGSSTKFVINWGSHNERISALNSGSTNVINPPDIVRTCANKTAFFELMDRNDVSIPDYTTSAVRAREWIEDGELVIGRSTNERSGRGMSFSDEASINDILRKQLFVKYIPKKAEFRVHFFNGKIIDVQQKRLRTEDLQGNKVDPKRINWRVRSFDNGFVFCRENLEVPKDVIAVAEHAANILNSNNLTFGALDIIYNKKRDTAYALECNTAPGIEGSTVQAYEQAILRTFT